MSRLLPLCVLPVFLAGCIHLSMDPIQVHAVVDVNVRMEQAVTELLTRVYGSSKTINTDALPSDGSAPSAN